MYYLDLATLLQWLQGYRRSCTIHAQLPPKSLGRQRGDAWLELELGKVVSCLIKSSTGQILQSGNAALSFLVNLGELNWDVTDLQKEVEPPTRTTQEPSTFSPVPRRLVSVDQRTMSGWSRLHRHVYVLVDGERDVNKIALLLSLPGERDRTFEALGDLQSWGVISL